MKPEPSCPLFLSIYAITPALVVADLFSVAIEGAAARINERKLQGSRFWLNIRRKFLMVKSCSSVEHRLPWEVVGSHCCISAPSACNFVHGMPLASKCQPICFPHISHLQGKSWVAKQKPVTNGSEWHCLPIKLFSGSIQTLHWVGS